VSNLKAAKEVDRALAEVARRVKNAVKDFNQRAADLVSRGKYGSAEPVMESARSMRGFQDKLKVLRDEWKKLLRASKPQGEIRDKTPLWEYYRPILEALVGLGGEATRQDLEKKRRTNTGLSNEGRRFKDRDERDRTMEVYDWARSKADDQRRIPRTQYRKDLEGYGCRPASSIAKRAARSSCGIRLVDPADGLESHGLNSLAHARIIIAKR